MIKLYESPMNQANGSQWILIVTISHISHMYELGK